MTDVAGESPRIQRAAWLIWIALGLAISIVVLRSQDTGERSVTGSYRAAVQNWFAGEPLYNMAGSGFIYMPQAALVFAPWGLLPKLMGEITWRWTILIVFAAGVFRLARLLSRDDRWFMIATLASAGTGAGCVRNGQSTLMIAGLMMLATVDLKDQKWWRATVLLSLAFAFKPVSIVLILLVAAIYPQMLWRLAIGMSAVGVAPFLTQRPDYVISQFVACYQNSRIAFSVGETGHWAQLFGMLKVAGLDLPSPVQQIGRLTAAVATLGVCWIAVRRLPANRSAFYLYAISACYLMLFNSRTEGSTYAMVGPVYGILLSEAWLVRRLSVATLGYSLAIIATVVNFDLALLVVRRPNEIWLAPLICVLVTACLLGRLTHDIRMSSEKSDAQ
ncbi:MAG: glycosyltransferase family 87 protein [Planctomycetota bacterium]